MFLKRISMTNILSFGDKATEIELKPLNILIGHNGSGKSNFIESLTLLRRLTRSNTEEFNDAYVADIAWKGGKDFWDSVCKLDVSLEAAFGVSLRYAISFTADIGLFGFSVLAEEIDMLAQDRDELSESICYLNEDSRINKIYVKQNNKLVELNNQNHQINSSESILSQLKDPLSYGEITALGTYFNSIKTYRDWAIGGNTSLRFPHRADLPNNFLLEDLSNIGLILNKLRTYPEAKRKVLESLRNLYPSAEDFEILVEANTVQIFIQEGNFLIPATRLSDGTLRFLCLLAILCHPKPPPLICIEEPELGLHPDMIHIIADLLRDASTRTQLIVTTHSDLLVEEFSDEPECVLTFEKQGDQTEVHRLDAEELSHWLEKYSLGQLRRKGHIAGNRW